MRAVQPRIEGGGGETPMASRTGPVPSPASLSPPWASLGFNRFSLEPKLGRSFTPGAQGASPARPARPDSGRCGSRAVRRSSPSGSAEPGSRSLSRSRSCEDADKAERLRAAAEAAAMVAVAVGDPSATYRAGARPGRAGAERVEPEPEPERGGRPLSPSARRLLCGRAAPPAGPEGGGAPAAPPSSARPPRPLLLPASIPATCQLGGRRRLRGHAPKGLAPAPGLRMPGPAVSQEE